MDDQAELLDHQSSISDGEKKSFSFVQQILRWSLSISCVAFLLATLKIYQGRGNLTPTQIAAFNGFTTALTLILGLAFFDAFRDLAKVSRWIILKNGRWSASEEILLNDIAKLTNVIRLLVKSWKKAWIFWACLLWITLNLAAQTAVALINQGFSFQGGTDWHGVYYKQGLINVTELSTFCHYGYDAKKWDCDAADATVQGVVHSYGESAYGSLSQSYDCERYNETKDVLKSQKNPKYYCRREPPGKEEFTYRFTEYNPNDHRRIYPHLTDRTITASSSKCSEYLVSHVDAGSADGENWSKYNYTDTDGTLRGTISLPAQIDVFDGTVYIYRGSETPQIERTWACGERCISMWAHKTVWPNQPSTFYQCNITVGLVENAFHKYHQVLPHVARLAASAIGLQGGTATNGSTQFQFYPSGNPWDIHNKPIEEVGANMAEFALGSIATMSSKNPSLQVLGSRPELGSRLDVDWSFSITLLVSITVVHTAVFALAFFADWPNRHP